MLNIPKILILSFTFLFSQITQAQPLWQGTTSGMTPIQVRATIPQLLGVKPQTLKRNNETVTTLNLNNVQIEGSLYSALFIFHQDKLNEVTLSLNGSPTYLAAMQASNALTKALRKKYGKEISQTESNGLINKTTMEWLSQGTQIGLAVVSSGNETAELTLSYRI